MRFRVLGPLRVRGGDGWVPVAAPQQRVVLAMLLADAGRVVRQDNSVGSVLALPQPVWDSWRPFLGAPEVRPFGDGTYRLLDDDEDMPVNWIYVFDVAARPAADGGATPVEIKLVIGTDAATLTRAALEVTPARAIATAGCMRPSQRLSPLG